MEGLQLNGCPSPAHWLVRASPTRSRSRVARPSAVISPGQNTTVGRSDASNAASSSCRYVHHVVTIALVWGSYSYNYVRIGTVVLYLHDLSDIMVDLLKLTNYMKLEGPKGG